jgi:hypothetical protein
MNLHTLAIVLILGGVGAMAWGVLSSFADGMSDTSGANSGGCTFGVVGLIAIIAGTVGLFL